MTTATPPLPQVADAETKRERLDQMKRRATGLLVLATIIFVVTRLYEARYPWLGYLRATAEAAMVGGVADWFAITALFRHPLGIPIPHTAIVPSRKDRIGRSLGNFVQNNFLSREVLGAKLQAAELSRRAAEWLREPEHSRALALHAIGVLRGASEVVRDEDVHALLDRSVVEPLRRAPIAPALAKGLSLLTVNDRHQRLLDQVVKGLSGLVLQNQELIRRRIREESPWWVPDFVDDRVHDKVMGAIERTLLEVGANPAHPLRQQFDALLSEWIVELQESPEAMARAEAIKQQIFDNPTSKRLSASLWEELKRALERRAQAANDGAPGGFDRWLNALAEAALEDQALLDKVDGWMIEAVLSVIDQHRNEVGQLISNTVSSWDPEETSRRIELQIGRDLQFVRINGTLVGGLVGLILYVLSK
ncbi:MAG TPA: DUF445 family protein [Gemmatimonadales bacterium]|jgi:uncharacterized membrane-anchored protein YjiN (DUF445 family)